MWALVLIKGQGFKHLFLFATILDVLSEERRKGPLYELLYADDLVLITESIKELGIQFNYWKAAFEEKGLRVNMGTTTILELSAENLLSVEVKIDPCSVCGRRARKLHSV